MACCAINVPSHQVTKAFSTKNSASLAPRSTGNGQFPADVCSLRTEASFSDFPCPSSQDKENRVTPESRSWLSKVCSKLRHKHRRQEKCEKCGQRSDTCQANPSFVSSRKHYLCQDCRVSARNMKSMYHQLCRNLSLREPTTRTACHSGDASPPASSSADGLTRSKSMRGVATSRQAPESGYETATSLDSSCSNGRLSPDPVSTSSGEGACCSARLGDSPVCSQRFAGPLPTITDTANPSNLHLSANCSKDNHVCSKDKADIVFSSPVVKREENSLHQVQAQKPQQRVFIRKQQQQQKQHPAPQQQQQRQPESHHHQHPHNDLKGDGQMYDGYLEVRKASSRTVTYVFKKAQSQKDDQLQHQKEGEIKSRRMGGDGDNDCAMSGSSRPTSRGLHTENLKQCYRCSRFRSVAFRAPFCHGWLCEDCMDDLM